MKKLLCVYAIAAAFSFASVQAHNAPSQEAVDIETLMLNDEDEKEADTAHFLTANDEETTQEDKLFVEEETKVIPGALACDCAESKCVKEKDMDKVRAGAYSSSEKAQDSFLACKNCGN